ncbi:MAG TPA: MBL fold metallo-hydrolase [Chloroflexi bacterium]|nr:MBL fold metallo-hydrolase [Chloroflexota bacterium]
MLLKHFFLGKIAHSSYLLAGKESCAVIDPQRDVDLYISQARELGVAITHVLQTHLHADFISGHMDLATRTGAKIYMPKSADCPFDHVPTAEGDAIEIEDMLLQVMETPGHTPEHVSYAVTDRARGDTPIGVFVGDTLFVGDVGRPDLFPSTATQLAGQLYDSLHHKLLQLPDYCEVYPAHGAGSLCGRAMGAKWLTTIGYERRYNAALQLGKHDFVRSLTTNMPPAPDHFSRCSGINRDGPTLLDDLPALEELRPSEFRQRMDETNVEVVDVRTYTAFASLHIPGAWHLDLNGNFPTFAGWVLPVDKEVLLVADDYADAVEATLWARRVGVDRIVGYLHGGMADWATQGQLTSDIHLVSAEDLHDRVTGTSNMVLVDVRAPLEFQDGHIKGAVNIPAPDLRSRYNELDPDKPTFLVCSSGNRSSLAGSILKRHAFKEIHNVAGGMTGYSAAGYARQCAVCENPHGSRFFATYLPTETVEI